MSAESRLVAVQEQAIAPMTVMGILERRAIVQQVIEETMIEGLHYGTIPGTSELSLMKEGAELLLSTFNIAVEPTVTDQCTQTEVRFQVECRGIHMGTGRYVGSGLGVCTSNEEKYRWRKARSAAEYDAADPTHRRIKYGRDYQDRQVRQSPWDVFHTIMSMAKKRAMVDLAKTALAASECLKRAKLAKIKRPPPATPPAEPTKTAGTAPNGKKAEDKPRPATPASPQTPPLCDQDQVNTLYTRLDDTGIPENAFLARFELGTVEELDAARYDAAMAWLSANSP